MKGVKIPRNPKGEGKSFAFIEFQHECSVDYAIQLFHRTCLFGKELQLKTRRSNNTAAPVHGQSQELRRTNSLPVMQHFPFATPPFQFFRPPLMPGFVLPHPMANPMMMQVPARLNQHIHFGEDGLHVRSDAMPIPLGENSIRTQLKPISMSYEDDQPSRRRDSDHRPKYSDSLREDYESRYEGRRSSRTAGGDDRRSSYHDDSEYRERKRLRESSRYDSRDDRHYREDGGRGSGRPYESESNHRRSYEGSGRSWTSDRR